MIFAVQQPLESMTYTAIGPARDRRLLERLIAAQAALRALSRQELAETVTHSQIMEVRRGAAIVRRGERMPGLILLGTGSAKLSLRRRNGEENVLRLLDPGDTFGLAATVLDRPSPVDLLALSPCLAAVVPPIQVQKLLESNATFARALTRALAERFLELVGELESSVQHSSLQRLACYLLSLACADGGGAACVSRLPATKTTVAARLGVKKETLSRLLHALAERRLIEVRGRDIALLDRPGLLRVAERGF